MHLTRFGELEGVLLGGSDGRGGGTGPVVVLLHGYGAPGVDLVPLAEALSVPESFRFLFLFAPLVLAPGLPPHEAPRAWWPIDMVSLQVAAMTERFEDFFGRPVPAGLAESRAKLEGALEILERAHAAPLERVVLGGFSQGAMLALDTALRLERAPAGVALLSGTWIAREEWQARFTSRRGLPVFQSHGLADPVLPFSVATALRDALLAAGLNVEFHAFGGGHGIPMPVLAALGVFLEQTLAAKP